MNDVRPEIVRERSGRADGQPGNHRQYGCERDGRDKGKENISGQCLRQQRRAHVRAAMGGNVVASDNGRGSKAEERGHDVETADQHHRPNHARACRLGIGNGVEAHQDVRQSGGAKDEGQAE